MNRQITFVVKTLKYIQGGKVFTWRTPFLAVQYVFKLVYEQLGSLQSLPMTTFLAESNAEFTLLPARNRTDVYKAECLYVHAFDDRHGGALLAKLYQQFPHLFFVMLKGEKLVGYCVYTLDPTLFARKRTACLYSLAVDVHFRGGGYARYMMEKTLDYLKENSVSKVYLHVYPDNKNAIHLYESFGFKLIRVTKTINPKRNRMWLMEKSAVVHAHAKNQGYIQSN